MKGSRLRPNEYEGAGYRNPAAPDPAIRRSPLATPDGISGGQARQYRTCDLLRACRASVIRLGAFADPECEAAIERQQIQAPLTPLQVTVLETLAAHPDGLRVNEIIRLTGLRSQSVDYALNALRRRELLVAQKIGARSYVYRPVK